MIVVGGGPGGVACALALMRGCAEAGRGVRVTIVEGKRFSEGEHYNQCVGVLSPPLQDLLERDLGVAFPDHLSRGEIRGYVLHSVREQLRIAGEGVPSTVVRRVQFDAYMLEVARQRGAQVVSARAVDLEFNAREVVVYTESAPLAGDVVVGAFGLDDGSAAMFERLTAYRRPRALSSVVTKYHPGQLAMQAFGSWIHAFLPPDPRVEFAAVTPKGNHLTINIAGKAVDSGKMRAFLRRPEVRAVLPNLEKAGEYDPNDLRLYKGRFPYSLARAYFGDRYVMVGDAAGIVRAFKGKGVTSAVQTGIRAARAILEAGISAQAFRSHYRRANMDIIRDLPYGRAMRLATILMARSGLLDAVLRAARGEPRLQAALYGAVSGGAAYGQVWRDSLAPASVRAVLGAALTGRRRAP